MYGYNSEVLVIGDYYIFFKDLGSHVIGTERRTPEASKRVCYRWLYSQA